MRYLETMAWILFGFPAGLLIAIFVVRRLLTWMEDRGYLIISEVTDSSRTLGSALLNLQELVEPGSKHIIEARDEEEVHEEEGDSGDPEEAFQRQLRRQILESVKGRPRGGVIPEDAAER